MTNSIIAIRGNYLDRQQEIFEAFKYEDSKQDKYFDNLSDLYAYLFGDNYFNTSNQEKAFRGIWFNNGWTIVCDPETVDIFDDKALLNLSNIFNSEVITFLIQTTSGSFGFAKYNITTQRNFFSTNGEIINNTGTQMVEEFSLNINEHIFADDVTGLAKKLGIDFDQSDEHIFIGKQLVYNEEIGAQFQQYQSHKSITAKTIKPWWKFW